MPAAPKPRHQRRKPKRAKRNEFTPEMKKELREHFNNQCQECGALANHIHHVKKRSNSGRAVWTNALLLCGECHTYLHNHSEREKHWVEVYKEKYGEHFFRDRIDLEDRYLTDDLKAVDNEMDRWLKHNG